MGVESRKGVVYELLGDPLVYVQKEREVLTKKPLGRRQVV